MATLYISKFGGAYRNVAYDPLGATTITTSGTSAATSAAVSGIVKVQSDTAHYITVAETPTATAANGAYIGANEVLWLNVPFGHKIAAITA